MDGEHEGKKRREMLSSMQKRNAPRRSARGKKEKEGR
jgi:hypothetical protein